MRDQIAQAKALGATLGGSPTKNIAKLHDAEIKLSEEQTALRSSSPSTWLRL